MDRNPTASVGVTTPCLPDSLPVDARIEGSHRTMLYGCPETLAIFSTALAAK
jgi:hypothetical protein